MMTPLRNVGLLAALVVACLGADHFRSAAQSHYLSTQRYEDVYYLPPPKQLVTVSLGYRETLADLIWMKALIYFGEELMHRGGVAHLYGYTDAMLTLDPRFKKVYHWVASASIYRTGDVTVSDVRKAIRYLERGARLFPDDGELAWDLGATYSFELAPMLKDPQERAEAKRRGLESLELAALRGAGPPWLVLQTAGQLDNLGKTEQAIRHLEDVYATVSDDNVKQRVVEQIARLRSSAYAEALKRTTQELERARVAAFPYMDATLFVLMGHRPPFDGTALLLRGFDPQPRPSDAQD
jgi:hypothetical protein